MIPFTTALGWTRSSIAVLVMIVLATSVAARELAGPSAIDWDQVANIRSAAERIGRVQRARGAEVAMTLISNCYKTHTLFESYSRGFEGCLVQDHLQTRVLVEVYSRMKPEALRRIGAPSKESLMRSNVARFAATLAKYKFPPTYAMRIRNLADKHGWPVFLKIVFPAAERAKQNRKPVRRKR